MIKAAFFLIYLAGFIFLGWMVWIAWQMRKKGAPFWPSSQKRVDVMLELAQVTENDCVTDLGSGDGRLVLAAAEKGAKKAVGYEIDPFWLNVSQEKKEKSPQKEKIQFLKESFWEKDLSEFNVVFLYQGKHVLKDLGEKLKKELPKGARVISNCFPIPNWKAEKVFNNVYLYRL